MSKSSPDHKQDAAMIAAIVPAYNEAKGISRVLGVLCEVDILSEIIVVDDGSKDFTAIRVKEFAERDARIRLIQHAEKMGKGQAIFTAFESTQAPILLLLDADLVGLAASHIHALIEPVLKHRADMSLGLFKGGHILTDFSHWITPWLSGQRCLKTEILSYVDARAAAGYGFETALTMAARYAGYETKIVSLHGVWHPPSEFHRDPLYTGVWRLRMYAQIIRAWYLTAGWVKVKNKVRKRIMLLISIMLLMAFVLPQSSLVDDPTSGVKRELANMPMLFLENYRRILVVAPHPDDETLAAGGLIQKGLAQGSQIKVVVVTNGDGQRLAPELVSKKVSPHGQDYIAMGERRQAESLAALQDLGLPSKDAIYLGYPDRGLDSMWLQDWNKNCPYISSYTKSSMNPYPDTYQSGVSYCGNNLLNNLEDIINTFRPDLIVLPHPADQNLDHAATSNFVQMALAVLQTQYPDYDPQMWGYIVHYESYPQPRGKHYKQILLPPRHLEMTPNAWGYLSMDANLIATKYQAIKDYPTQDFLLGRFLPSFARSDEIFALLPMQVVLPTSTDLVPLFSQNMANVSSQDDFRPEDLSVKGNSLIGWRAVRADNDISLTLEMRRDILPDVSCVLRLKFPNGDLEKMTLYPSGSSFAPRIFRARLDLASQSYPSVFSFAAEIHQAGIMISRTGWHILLIK